MKEPVQQLIKLKAENEGLKKKLKEMKRFLDEEKENKIENLIHKTNEYLEQEINQRTTELKNTNEALKKEIKKNIETRQRLEKNEEKFRNIIAKSPIGFVLVDETGKIIEWNEAQAELTGIKPVEALEKYFWEIVDAFHPDENKDEIRQRLRDITRTLLLPSLGNGQKSEITRERKIKFIDGHEKYLQSLFFAIPAPGGVFIANYNMDITESKNTSEAIRNSEAISRAFINNSEQVFILLNNQLEILDYNRITREFGKAIFHKTIKKKVSFASNKTPFREEMEQALKGRKVTGEFTININGNEQWMEFCVTPVYLQASKIFGIVFNAFDITNTKKAEIEVKKTLDKEKELNNLKSQFISTVSHEFRTPLANIILNTQLIEKISLLNKNEKIGKSFSRIYNSIEYLVNMLNEVSLISKDQSGKLIFTPSSVNPEELCLDIIEQVKSLQENPGRIKWQNNAPGVKKAFLDKDLFSHIFNNLLNNAIKFSPKDKPVSCTLDKPTNHSIQLTVKDEGIGIPKNEMKYIYEPYHRGTNVGNIKGTGLGLSIVNRCIELHDGKIEIKSKPDQGTTARVSFPLKPRG